MAQQKPVSYKDPYWINLAAEAEQRHGLPEGSLQTIITHGERSNADQVSEKGATTVFQIVPTTRSLVLKKYGIDSALSDKNAADAAALIFKEGLNRNNNDPIMAAREYHGGVNRDNWGNVNKAYAQRYAEGLQAYRRGLASNAIEQPAQKSMLERYQSNELTPEEKTQFEQEVASGVWSIPEHQAKALKIASPKPNKSMNAKEYEQFVMQEWNKFNDERLKKAQQGELQSDTSLYGKVRGAGGAVFQGVAEGVGLIPKAITKPYEWVTGDARPNEAVNALIDKAGQAAQQSTSYEQDSQGNIVPVITDYRLGNQNIVEPIKDTAAILAPAGAARQLLSGGAQKLAAGAESIAASPRAAAVLQTGSKALQGAANLTAPIASTAPVDLGANLAANIAANQIQQSGGGAAGTIGGAMGAGVLASILLRKYLPTGAIASSGERSAIQAEKRALVDAADTIPSTKPVVSELPTQTTTQAPLSEAITPTPATPITPNDIGEQLAKQNADMGGVYTEAELTAMQQDYEKVASVLASNKEQFVKAIQGSPDELENFAKQFDVDVDLLKAYQQIPELSLQDIPASVLSKNPEIKAVGGAAQSVPASLSERQYNEYIKKVNEGVGELMGKGGRDAAKQAQNVKTTMLEQESAIHDVVSKNYNDLRYKMAQASENSPIGVVEKTITDPFTGAKTVTRKGSPVTVVEGNKTRAYIDSLRESARSPDLQSGGTYVPKDVVPSVANKIYASLKKGLSYPALDQYRQEVGEALYKNRGAFLNQNTGVLSKLYSTLLEDLDEAAVKYGFNNEVQVAKTSYKELAAHRKNLMELFGKEINDNYINKLSTATSSALNAGEKNQVLVKLLDAMPEDMRGGALNSALANTFTDKSGRIRWQNLAGTWKGLENKNSEGVAIFKKYLGQENFNRWNAVAKIAEGVTNHEKFIMRNGRALFGAQEIEDAASFGQNIAEKTVKGIINIMANKAGLGAFSGATTSAASSQIGAIMRPRTLESLGELFNNPTFMLASLTRDAKKRRSLIEKLAKKPFWSKAFGKNVTVDNVDDVLKNNLKDIK